MKVCEACTSSLHLGMFYSHKKGGYSNLCKPCTIADNRLRRQDPEKHRAVQEERQRTRQMAKTESMASVTSKPCSRCKSIKDLDAFRKHRGLYGRSSWCLECEREAERAYQEGYRDRINSKKRDAWAKNPLTQEQKAEASSRSREWYAKNKERASSVRKEYYLTHKAEIVANVSSWIKAHPDQYKAYRKAWDVKSGSYRRRAMSPRISDFDVVQWAESVEYFNHCCAYCLRQCSALTMDHMIPLVKGGDHTSTNIVPSCKSCNSKKHDHSIFTMLNQGVSHAKPI